jgi:PAS domain S-box-containing protein
MAIPAQPERTFLDAAPDSMIIVNNDGVIEFINIAAEQMFRYARTELVGQPVEVLLPGRFRIGHREHVARYRLEPRRRPMGEGLELVAQRRDGSEFPVEISLSPVASGAEAFIVAAIRDITARRADEQSLKTARHVAEQADRAKSDFLAAASHDLRQPLQTLKLLNTVLTRSVPIGSTAAMAVANQSEALRVMSELLNSLLDISRLDAGVIKPDITDCSVDRILRRLHAEFAALAESRGLELVVSDCDTVIRTDPTLLCQIMQNLLSNAIRYTRKGVVSLRCRTAPDTVRLEVLDTGIGIAPEELELIFEAFYRNPDGAGRDSQEGVGLGLAIARRAADLLGCSLQVSSTVGKGSRFSLSVPRSRSQPPAEDRGGARAAPSLPEHALVLIVDDDLAVANATSMLLGSTGLDCIVVPGAAEALKALRNRGDAPPDLMICDYHLGRGKTGLDTIAEVRGAMQRPLPVILVSGDTSASPAAAARGLDRCRLLSKPVDADELMETVAKLLAEGDQ